MNTVTQSKVDQFNQAFKGYESNCNAVIIGEKSKLAIKHLSQMDFPTSRTENWKYTRVNKIVNSNFAIQQYSEKIDLTPYLIPELDCHTMVFVNGFYRVDLSCSTNEAGLELMPISEVQSDFFEKSYGSITDIKSETFATLNSSFPSDGVSIFVKKNVQVSKPIHVMFLSTGEDVISQPRNLIVTEQGAKLEVIFSEFSLDESKTFSNGVTEVIVGDNASVSVELIQKQNNTSFLLNQTDVSQGNDSRFMINTLSVEGAWIRNNLNIKVAGQNCETHLNGTYAPKGKSHIDNHTVVDHLVPHCESHELYKGIVYDQATAVFNGKVFVRPDAQQTNAYQQNANILMSDSATVDSKPELEIYADDVKCSHGSTIGQFDENALFYLMARGISKENAKKLLVNAFVGDVIGKISNLKVRKYVFELF